ncbi:MAG TPA: VWA domain-containing protein [Vicinamibacterales bacterium]|nr:VWA domain-containing protein [Vicinamibacterales bacterium]
MARTAIALIWSLLLLAPVVSAAQPAAVAPPAFKASVELVTVDAVVRDRQGHLVSGLRKSDFEVLDDGWPRTIEAFHADDAPASVAVVVDTSGSMEVADKIALARRAATDLLGDLDPATDQAAVYTFDTALREIRPFAAPGSLKAAFSTLKPYGATSVYDAIAEAARQVARQPRPHRAVVIFTDGLDNASRLTPQAVSGLASSIDVPVYVVAVVSPLDRAAVVQAANSTASAASTGVYGKAAGALEDLARWTGGELFVASGPDEARAAMRQVAEELHHQYLLAFEPGLRPGWHPLVIRTRNSRLTVRARGGYVVGTSRPTG